MANENISILIGNLTRQPEVRTTNSGSKVCDFGMAVNRKWKTKDGQDGEETMFIDVSAWGRVGEVVAEYCQKGSPLFVRGRLKQDTWEKDGVKRSKHTVVAESVQLLSGKREDGQAPATSPAAPQAATGGGRESSLPF